MKIQFFVLGSLSIALTACGEKPQQTQYIPQQYVAPTQQSVPVQAAPVIVQAAPAQNNGNDAVLGLAAGAALGAVAANAMNNNNNSYQRDYRHEPQSRVINNTTIIKEKKVVIVQPQAKPSYVQPAPKVNLAKQPIQSYKSPTISMPKQSSPSTAYGKR